MNREALARWLATPRRTWRWSRDDVARYDAVEATPDALRWFRWSHEPEEGGLTDERTQSVEAFRREGTPPGMDPPPHVVSELRRWLEVHEAR